MGRTDFPISGIPEISGNVASLGITRPGKKTQANSANRTQGLPLSRRTPQPPGRRDRLVGLVVKASASRAEGPGFESH